jgi:hypothetical protein
MVGIFTFSGMVSELRAAEGDLGPPVCNPPARQVCADVASVPNGAGATIVSRAATATEHSSLLSAATDGPRDPKTDPAFRAWAEMRALAGKPLLLRCIKA